IGAGERIEYAAFGDTVNTAARLQSAARPGTVLAGALTQQLTSALFAWGDPQELALRGKADPVTAFEVGRPLPSSGRSRRHVGAQAPIVGRDAELAAGDDVIRDILAGRGGVLFVTGEAGIGKSRLIAELRGRFESAEVPGARSVPLWLEGRCVS